jgi:hypothetical protein
VAVNVAGSILSSLQRLKKVCGGVYASICSIMQCRCCYPNSRQNTVTSNVSHFEQILEINRPWTLAVNTPKGDPDVGDISLEIDLA